MLSLTRVWALAWSRAAAALLGPVVFAVALPATASASHRQITIIQDDGQLQANPAGTLAQMQALGATTVRVIFYWSSVAPDITAIKKPNFDASNPNAYSAAKWAPYDEIVRDATADGMTIDFTVGQSAPRWAEGPGIPSNYIIQKNPLAKTFAWKPNAADFGQFMQAVATRYDGKFTPAGQRSSLPRVHFWTIWNEPNFGEYLGPQATDTSRISYAPMLYRNLVRTGYRALVWTGHAHDTILIGELAAHGYALSDGRHGPGWPQGLPGNAAQTQPLPFIRTLYCLSQSGVKLTGIAAKNAGCPTTAKGRAGFRKDNPGLFDATGVGDHPYANDATPASDGRKANPNWSTLPNLPRLERTLDEAVGAYGSRKRYPIYNDEYGYITNPPNTQPGHSVPISTAATYLNWAEYITWSESRVASYDQYLLDDPTPNPASPHAGFDTGLYTHTGTPKVTVNAFRLPLWIPSTSLRRPGRDKVWGEARPAHWTGKDTKRTQVVAIQFRAHGKSVWNTIAIVHTDTYFVARPRLAASGGIRLRYTYPQAVTDPLLPLSTAGTTIDSRTQNVTVR